MAQHELKTWPKPFAAVVDGRKLFEIRNNDREFDVGDTLRLREYNRGSCSYSGRSVDVVVTYVETGWGLPDGLVVLGIRHLVPGEEG